MSSTQPSLPRTNTVMDDLLIEATELAKRVNQRLAQTAGALSTGTLGQSLSDQSFRADAGDAQR